MSSKIIILIALILFSAFFSGSETAFSSLNKIHLKYLANNGDQKAEKTLKTAENFSSVLSTVLIGNNIVNILSTSIATLLFVEKFGNNGVAISTVVMTILVLIFGEILPKSFAKRYPEEFATAVRPVLSFFITILKPISLIFECIEKIFFKNTNTEDEFNSEEIITMVEEAQEDGDIDLHEADLITNALEFNDLDVGEILTPRIDVIACSIEDSVSEVEEIFRESGFSRLPCYEGSIDNIIGVLHEKDFYHLIYTDKKQDFSSILQKVIYTSEQVKISALLRQLQSSKNHLAVVIDEYGGTAGIITMEDILEELVGEIYDEHDEVIEYIKVISEGHYCVDGDLDIDDLFQYLDIKPDEDDYDFNTTSAWIIHMMDRIPMISDSFKYEGYIFTVQEADEKIVSLIDILKED